MHYNFARPHKALKARYRQTLAVVADHLVVGRDRGAAGLANTGSGRLLAENCPCLLIGGTRQVSDHPVAIPS